MPLKLMANLTVAFAALMTMSFGHAQVGDCSAAVSLEGAVVSVEPSDGDDTENLQCAIDAAIDGKFTEVRLSAGDYEVSSLEFRKYKGIFGGAGFEDTFVTVLDEGLQCVGGTNNAVFKVVLGNVVFRWMTVDVGSPCSGNSDSSSVAVFGFYTDGTDCGKRVTFGQVDRTRIRGLGAESSDYVIGIVADTALECDFSSQQLAGVFAINRSILENLDFGVLTSVAVSEQVDITYNDFVQVGLPISIIDAKQTTTIQGNVFDFNDVPAYGEFGELGTTALFIASTSLARNGNSTVLLGNTFNNRGVNSAGIAVLTGQFGEPVTHSFLMVNNDFFGSDDDAMGVDVASIDTSDGVISSNEFSGTGETRISISSGDIDAGYAGVEVQGWAIAGNVFKSGATTDIVFGSSTSGNVVAKDQNSPCVTDNGNNDILESCSSSSSAGLIAKNQTRSRLFSNSLESLFRSRAKTFISNSPH